jgi:hypothetical protein
VEGRIASIDQFTDPPIVSHVFFTITPVYHYVAAIYQIIQRQTAEHCVRHRQLLHDGVSAGVHPGHLVALYLVPDPFATSMYASIVQLLMGDEVLVVVGTYKKIGIKWKGTFTRSGG